MRSSTGALWASLIHDDVDRVSSTRCSIGGSKGVADRLFEREEAVLHPMGWWGPDARGRFVDASSV